MNRNNKRWTVEQEDRLLRLVNKGMTHKEIAEVLGRTQGAVAQRICDIKYREETPAPTSPNKLGSKDRQESTTITTLCVLLSVSVFIIGLLLLGE